MSDEYQKNHFQKPAYRLPPQNTLNTKKNSERGRFDNKVDNIQLDGLSSMEARVEIMKQIAAQQRRRGMVWSDEQRQASEAARYLALSDPSQEGHDALVNAYVRAGAMRLAHLKGMNVGQLVSHWKATAPKGR